MGIRGEEGGESDWSCLTQLKLVCNSLQHCKQVLGVEIIEEAVRDAKFNAEANQIDNCKFFTGNSDDFIKSLMHEAGVKGEEDILAVVDPPRAGLRE